MWSDGIIRIEGIPSIVYSNVATARVEWLESATRPLVQVLRLRTVVRYAAAGAGGVYVS